MADFTIKHIDNFERSGKWHLARRSLDLRSFGLNVFDLKPGEDIPEHNEIDRDQEEVFIVLDGEATVVIDGRNHPAPAGTYVRIGVKPERTVRNDSQAPVRVLIASAPRTSGYEPMSWG